MQRLLARIACAVILSALCDLAFLPVLRAEPPPAAPADPASPSVRKVVLDNHCLDPMELAVTPDGRVIFVERAGLIKIWKPDSQTTVTAGTFNVNYHPSGSKNAAWEDGLIGITLDPDFSQNHWLYL